MPRRLQDHSIMLCGHDIARVKGARRQAVSDDLHQRVIFGAIGEIVGNFAGTFGHLTLWGDCYYHNDIPPARKVNGGGDSGAAPSLPACDPRDIGPPRTRLQFNGVVAPRQGKTIFHDLAFYFEEEPKFARQTAFRWCSPWIAKGCQPATLSLPQKTSPISSLALEALVLADSHMLGASCAGRRQPQHAKCRAEQGKSNRSQQRDSRAIQRIASQKQRYQARARRLAQEPRRPEHAACAAAALARGCCDNGPVVRCLEKTEPRPGERHPPYHVGHRKAC